MERRKTNCEIFFSSIKIFSVYEALVLSWESLNPTKLSNHCQCSHDADTADMPYLFFRCIATLPV